MSGGNGAIAVRMAELEATTPVSNGQADLDLNVDPPFSSDGLALELALGGQDFEGFVQVSRQNWPRFEPGMSELLAQEEEALPADSRVLHDLIQDVASPCSMHRVSTDLIQGGATPSARPRVSADLLHGGSRSSAMPRVSSNLLHGSTRPFSMVGVSASMCDGDISQSAISGVSASLLHGDTCPSAMPRVSADLLYDPRGVSAITSPTAMRSELVDLPHDGTSQSAMPRMSTHLRHNGSSTPSVLRVSVHDRASTLGMPRALSNLFHDGTHPSTGHNAFLDLLNICTSPFPVPRVSSDQCQDSLDPSPIPRGSNLSLTPLVSTDVLEEGRSSWSPMRRVSDDPPHQSTTPSPASSQASVSEHINLDALQGDDLAPFFLGSRRLSRSPLHWRRARRRITPTLNPAEAQSLSAGSAYTSEVTRVHDVRPLLGVRRLSANSRSAVSRTTCLGMSSAAVVFSSSESNHENVKETETGSAGAHFECNICLEMATEPVVSCCGHLFCWPCLYQWLHAHSVGKECPVCKGFLPDNAITPIYGRGNFQDTESSPGSIPPRPHGHRKNNKRCQQEQITQERLARDLGMTGEARRVNVGLERNDSEGSNTAVVFLEQLRVAQRLRQERPP